VLVEHRCDLDDLAVDGGVELEIDRPHRLGRIGSHLRRARRLACAFAWAVHSSLQALLFPQAVHLFLVHVPVLVVTQRRPGTPEPMTWIGC